MTTIQADLRTGPYGEPSVHAVVATPRLWMMGRVLAMARFSERVGPERMQGFWDALQAGEVITGAAAAVGTYRMKGRRWRGGPGGIRRGGGVMLAAGDRMPSARDG